MAVPKRKRSLAKRKIRWYHNSKLTLKKLKYCKICGELTSTIKRCLLCKNLVIKK